MTRAPISMVARRLGCAAAVMALMAVSAQASTTLVDTYWGGLNTYNFSNGDIIGPANIFDIQSAVVSRSGVGNGTLNVTINTNFAGKAGTDAGVGYGALFFGPQFTPTVTGAPGSPGNTPTYGSDIYIPGRFTYAFTIPALAGPLTSGNGGLFAVNNANVVMSNVYGNEFTYPLGGSYYIRQDQAVQYTPGTNDVAARNGTWSVGATSLTFSILDNGLLGNSFALAWAMTCANDIILGNVDLPPGETFQTPLPAAFPLFASGSVLLGFLGWRRRKKAVPAVA